MAAVTGNYQLLRINEQITENLSSVQIAGTLDDLIFNALTPLIRNSNYLEYVILELLPHIFLNQRRSFSKRNSGTSLKDSIFSFIMADDKEEKIKLLRKQNLERTVYFEALKQFEKAGKVYLDTVKTRLHDPKIKTNAKEIKQDFFVEKHLYETCQSVIYWVNYAYKFRSMIVEKYVRNAYNESVKMAAATNLNIDQEELFRNLLIVCHKAIDKYDPERGPLASYVNIWFMEAKTNHKNAHEHGVAMQMSTSQRKKLLEKGSIHTFTLELDEKIAESVEDIDYDVLQNMIDGEEDKILNNLSCRADLNKVFCLATGVRYTLTPQDLKWQRESCNG